MRLVVIGAGGHGKVVIEACRAAGHAVVGVIDPSPPADEVLGAPVLGDDGRLPELRAAGIEGAVVAVGGNASRQRPGEQCERLGFTVPAIVHPSALLSPSARLGPGAVLMARCVVGTATVVGAWAILNTGAVVDHDNVVGRAAHVAPGCALAGCVRVGERVLVGVGSSVNPGITIGDDAVIGGGSSVIADIAAGSVVGGTPARVLRSRARRSGA